MPGPREVIAWQKAMDLTVNCYHLSQQIRQARHSDLSSQLFRSSVSVPSNIAEVGALIHGLRTAVRRRYL